MKKVIKSVAALMLMTAVIGIAGCSKNDLSNHEYVDLGLPSGTLWATCNVGATTPEGYGDYFAWGETTLKDTYSWSTYKYCNGDYNQLTKYCSKSRLGYNGFTDNLTVLQSSDDAATANWGSGWRIPTRAEWIELYENTTNTWTTRNGVNGMLFTASNGNNLFLPAAGWHLDDEIWDVGSRCHYWSSSLDASIPNLAKEFDIDSVYAHVCGSINRYVGFSVRPIREN